MPKMRRDPKLFKRLHDLGLSSRKSISHPHFGLPLLPCHCFEIRIFRITRCPLSLLGHSSPKDQDSFADIAHNGSPKSTKVKTKLANVLRPDAEAKKSFTGSGKENWVHGNFPVLRFSQVSPLQLACEKRGDSSVWASINVGIAFLYFPWPILAVSFHWRAGLGYINQRMNKNNYQDLI